MDYSRSWTQPGQDFFKEAIEDILLMDMSPKHFKQLFDYLSKNASKIGVSIVKDGPTSILVTKIKNLGKAKSEVEKGMKKFKIRDVKDVDMRVD